MSSHHFVREGQEPALLIMGQTTFSSIEGLLEWAPTILVTQEMLEKVLSWGIRTDAVIGKAGDGENIAELLREGQIVDILAAADPVDVAVEYLLNLRQTQLAIITDSFSGIKTVVESQLDKIEIVVFEEDLRWIPIKREFRKWSAKSSKYRILAAENASFVVDGLVSELEFFAASADGMITIQPTGSVWLGEFYKS